MFRAALIRSARRLSARVWAALALACFAQPALCDAVADAEDAMRKHDTVQALRILEHASAGGDVAAKGRLASHLRNLSPPYRNVERGCVLAREAADAGDAHGAMTRAECLLTGVEKAAEPVALARELARAARKSGLAAAGFTVYLAYSMDPKYRYLQAGKADRAKYKALAAMPVSERGEQVEAFDALAEAMRAGHVNASLMGLSYLIDSSAPGNIARVINLWALLQKSGVQMPRRLLPFLGSAQEIAKLGTTHASVSAFEDAHRAALPNAAARLQEDCDAKDVSLSRLTTEPVTRAEYLPISGAPLARSYLVRGSWNEEWTFTGCKKSTVVRIAFTADGWSGVQFKAASAKADTAR
jgi:hypothetical protein